MTDSLFELLHPERLTAIVDIGANPIDGDPPYKRMLDTGLCTVVGFEPQADALTELNRRKGPRERYLPVAVGDGREQTLYVCRARGLTSTLPPDPAQLALFNELSTLGEVEREMLVQTQRLDDIDEIGDMDLLKIDIQGRELDVFNSGITKLSKAVAVQTEVSFIPLYEGQPSFGAVDAALRGLGFVPHCFAEIKLWPLSPLVIDADARKPVRQLLEADLVYVRDFAPLNGLNQEQWKHLALVAHHCYGSADLAMRAIMACAQLGAVHPNAASHYLEILQSVVRRRPQPGAEPAAEPAAGQVPSRPVETVAP